MAQEEIFAVPNVAAPNTPVIINDELCNGCNECVEVCMIDVFIPNPEAGQPPIILHPEECYYGGCCIWSCPIPGAITFNWPLMQRGHFRRKDTKERFRV